MDQDQMTKTILDEMGLNNLPQEKQEELLIKMTEVLLKRIFIETMDKLGEGNMEEYEKLVDSNASPEEIENFFQSKIPNYEKMVQKVVDDFKEEMKKTEI